MLTLFNLDRCRHCRTVRSWLEEHDIDYDKRDVPRDRSQRHEVFALGLESSGVPVLVDGDQVLQDSGRILDYLRQQYGG